MQLVEAINISLRALGESEIMSLNTSNPSAGAVRSIIDATRVSILSQGWWFNTVYIDIKPDIKEQVIKVPARTLSVIDRHGNSIYTVKNKLLFDVNKFSSVFTDEVQLKLIIDTPFEELPENIAQYIAYQAASDMYTNDWGEDNKSQRLDYRAQQAYRLSLQEQLRIKKPSTKKSPIYRRIINGIRA